MALALVALALLLWWRCSAPTGETPGNEPTGSDRDSAADSQGRDRAGGAMRPAPRHAGLDAALQAPRASIAGTVVDERGVPIAGATVCARAVTDRLPDTLTRDPSCASSDAGGYYRVAPLLAARYRVDGSAPSHVPSAYVGADGVDRVALSPGADRTGVDLVLHTGGVPVRGIVRDISGGVIEGAVVSLIDPRRVPGSSVGAAARTDAEGIFMLWAAPGMVRVQAGADGYASDRVQGVAPGQRLELRLTPGSTLVGRVVASETGEPLAGVPVTLGGGWQSFTREYPVTAFTDEAGGFRFEGLRPGGYTPEVRTETHYGRASRRVSLGFVEVSESVTIVAHPAAAVRGVVTTAEGTACPRGHVALTSVETGESFEGPVRSEGSVEIVALLPGRYRAEVQCPGFVAQGEYPDVEVGSEAVSGVRWTVEAGLTVSGVVVDAAGESVADATVFAEPTERDARERRAYGSGRSGPDGRFTLAGLVEGPYTVGGFKSGHLEASPQTRVLEDGTPAEPVTLTLLSGGTVRGRITDTVGVAVVGVSVRFEGPGRVPFMHNRDDGTFERTGLAPGPYRVWAAEGYDEPLRAPGLGDDDLPGTQVEVIAGETVEADLVVERHDGALRGTVVGPDGPVPDAFVRAGRESEASGRAARAPTMSRRTLTDLDGGFEIEGLRPGRYTVQAERRGGGGQARVEHVELDAEVRITLEDTASLAGTVIGVDGSAPERFEVEVVDPARRGAGQRQRLFRVEGRWRFDGLRPGTYRLAASAPNGVAEQEVTLAAAQERLDVALQLVARATVRGRVVDLVSGEPLPDMHVSLGAARGTATTFRSYTGREGGGARTGADGRFEIDNAPSGRVGLLVADWSARRRYVDALVFATVPPGEASVPDISMAADRRGGEAPGDLGLQVRELAADQTPEATPLGVAYVREGGPAAAAGIAVGDAIVSVDGHDVTGPHRYLYRPLTDVAPGTEVTLGLSREGEAVVAVVTAGRS